MNRQTKAIWLHVAASGRCTASEIRAEFPAMRFMGKNLNDMWRSNLMERYPIPGAKRGQECVYTYGVTRNCQIPRSVTMAELLEAMGNREEANG